MRPIVAFLVVCLLSQASYSQQPVRSILQKCFGPNCNQQSSSPVVAPFGYDKDGALITSVGPIAAIQQVPTVAPELPQATPMSAEPPAMESRAKRKTSRAAILEAVDKALDAGTIDADKARAIRRAAYRPRMLAQMEAFIAEKAVSEGYPMPMGLDGEVQMGAINWEALGDFIVKIAPIIFKLIELFM